MKKKRKMGGAVNLLPKRMGKGGKVVKYFMGGDLNAYNQMVGQATGYYPGGKKYDGPSIQETAVHFEPNPMNLNPNPIAGVNIGANSLNMDPMAIKNPWGSQLTDFFPNFGEQAYVPDTLRAGRDPQTGMYPSGLDEQLAIAKNSAINRAIGPTSPPPAAPEYQATAQLVPRKQPMRQDPMAWLENEMNPIETQNSGGSGLAGFDPMEGILDMPEETLGQPKRRPRYNKTKTTPAAPAEPTITVTPAEAQGLPYQPMGAVPGAAPDAPTGYVDYSTTAPTQQDWMNVAQNMGISVQQPKSGPSYDDWLNVAKDMGIPAVRNMGNLDVQGDPEEEMIDAPFRNRLKVGAREALKDVPDWLNKNYGNLLAAGNFFSNKRDIASLPLTSAKHAVNAKGVTPHRRDFAAINEAKRAARAATKGTRFSSAQQEGALKGKIAATTQSKIGQIREMDERRQDQLKIFNARQKNMAEFANKAKLDQQADDYMANRATQIGMNQRNRQALMDSFMGNEFMKKNYDLQLQKIGMISALDNGRNVVNRLRSDLGTLIKDPTIKKEFNTILDQYAKS